ncbi:MAG TPA: DUF2239 family protein [Allosphingosinicella sp.]|jgi:hypothetical protein
MTAFLGDEIVARGDPAAVGRELATRYPDQLASIRVFEDGIGQLVDLDYRNPAGSPPPPPPPRGPGRPSLGVTAREVTLLPRHWEFLSRRRGGVSAALRRLVEEAMRREAGPAEKRDAAYGFLSHMCGDRPGYEEALRALYRGEEEDFRSLIASWPEAIREYVGELLR